MTGNGSNESGFIRFGVDPKIRLEQEKPRQAAPHMVMNRTSLHITFLLQSLAGGGAERVAVLLAKGLVEQGHRVTMFLVRKEGPYLKDLSTDIRVITPPTRRTFFSIPWIFLHLLREKPDVLISHMTHVNVAAIIAGRLAGKAKRVLAVEHNQITQNVGLPLGAAVRLAYRLVPRIYPWAGRVVAVGGAVARDLESYAGLPAGSVAVIHNPVVTPEMVRKSREAVSHSWFQDQGPPVVLAVGRLHPQKDFETLIRAFALVRKRREARLLILGEGEERRNLQTLIGELDLTGSVELAGFADNPFAYLARASVFVLSSAWEGLPTVLIEALACGTPVVSTECGGGPSEIFGTEALGLLVPVRDPSAMADAICATLDDTEGCEARRRRGSDFSVARAVTAYVDLIEDTLAANCAAAAV